MHKRKNGSQIAPCIITKTRHALNPERKHPRNKKKCSKRYWDEVVDIVGADKTPEVIQHAKDSYAYYMW